MKRASILAYLFCIAADVFLTRFELHTDDAGIVALFIVVFTFILGCLHSRHAWQWALLVGPCVPAADFLWGPAPITTHNLENLGVLAGFVIALGLVGSYSGVFLRRGISAVTGRTV
jgi:hypothetical protein